MGFRFLRNDGNGYYYKFCNLYAMPEIRTISYLKTSSAWYRTFFGWLLVELKKMQTESE
jgi:hypothetical protein